MEWVALLVIVVVVALIMAILKQRQNWGQSEEYPYTRNQGLFSPAERSFLGILEQAIGDEYRAFGKVRVADVVDVKSMSDRRVWQRAFNRISAKHFDFVLCRNDDLTVLAVVELDDGSHQSKKSRNRDAFLVGLCDAIGLPLIQVPAQRVYSLSEVRATLMAAINPPVAESPILAEAIAQANLVPSSLSRLEFVVLAPEASIRKNRFGKQLARDSIRSKVRQRVSAYDGALDKWYDDRFEPTLDHIQLTSLSWEETIQWIRMERSGEADELSDFYDLCLEVK